MEGLYTEEIKSFVAAISDSTWMITADCSTIDNIFSNSLKIEDVFHQDDETELYKSNCTLYPGIDFKRSLDLLIENLIKNSNLNEQLTLYAMKKYTTFRSKMDLSQILEKIMTEIKLRKNISLLFEKMHKNGAVDVDWHRINSFIKEINTCSSDLHYDKILNALRMQTSIMLNAIEHGHSGRYLLDKVIDCLESQSDLKIWFTLMKKEHVNLVLELCAKYSIFLGAVLKFFDKFAEEIETNYDEDLNFKYSHLNLDFDEFLDLLKLFLSNENISGVINDYLQNKVFMEDKNFLFWVDVKACIEI